MAEPCALWGDLAGVPLHGEPCGEETICVVRQGCVHEHLTEMRMCPGCAVDEQKASGLIFCGRCAMTGPAPHDCPPLVVIEWDEAYRDPEPVTVIQKAGPGFRRFEPFSRCEVVKTDRGADLYVAWSHNTEQPRWIGPRAHAIAAGCEAARLDRADRSGSSYMPGAPGLRWDKDGLIAEQRGTLARERLAGYVTAWMDDRLTEAYSMLEAFDG